MNTQLRLGSVVQVPSDDSSGNSEMASAKPRLPSPDDLLEGCSKVLIGIATHHRYDPLVTFGCHSECPIEKCFQFRKYRNDSGSFPVALYLWTGHCEPIGITVNIRPFQQGDF